MIRTIVALGLIAATPALAHIASMRLTPTPAAQQIFERDWVLMNWALKFYDANRDVLLQPEEAAAAAAEFRRVADVNGDGRVTPEEYRAAREFILARY